MKENKNKTEKNYISIYISQITGEMCIQYIFFLYICKYNIYNMKTFIYKQWAIHIKVVNLIEILFLWQLRVTPQCSCKLI